MRAKAAALGTAVFLVVVPGTAAGVVPWLLTRWRGREPPLPAAIRLVGLGFVTAGAGILIAAFVRFVAEGRGTPAPNAPTERLVVGGLYRYVRNPMYLAVTATILGQALLLGRPGLLAYGVLFLVATATFVHVYEEPTLLRRYGPEYETYRRAVPAWWPRRRAWRPEEQEEPRGRATRASVRRHQRARGMRLKHQQADGFTVYASKTIAVPVDVLYDAFVKPRSRRKWLTDGAMSLRTSQPAATARFDWGDGSTRVSVSFEDKGPSKSTVSVAHERLPDADEAEATKLSWRQRLSILKSVLES